MRSAVGARRAGDAGPEGRITSDLLTSRSSVRHTARGQAAGYFAAFFLRSSEPLGGPLRAGRYYLEL